MTGKRLLRLFYYLALLTVPGLVVAFNAINLDEAYGGGPPYYSRTTNMDKWVSPLPQLIAVDTVALLAVAAHIYVRRRKR